VYFDGDFKNSGKGFFDGLLNRRNGRLALPAVVIGPFVGEEEEVFLFCIY